MSPTPSQPEDATLLMLAAAGGDKMAADRLLPLVYEQLRKAAQLGLAGEREGHTLSATALIHEAYLKLVGPHEVAWSNRGHFYAAAAEAMRRILIDYARARGRIKRGSTPVPLEGASVLLSVADLVSDAHSDQIVMLDEAVRRLWSVNGFDDSELKLLKEALAEWNKDYPAHVTAQQKAEGTRQSKDAARIALEKEVRPITNFVQGYPKTTDADRATIGITVRDTSRTPSPTPTTRPLVSVDPGTRLTHQLRLVDEGSPTRRGKPEGVAGAEVWVKLVDAGTPAPSAIQERSRS